MSRDAWLTQLRVAADDALAVVRLLADGAPPDGLQVAGQAVLRCSPSPDLVAIAVILAGSLSERAWIGDTELVIELDHVGKRTASVLSLLAVELDELGDAIDQSPASVCYVDLTSGIVWPAELFDVGQEPDDFDADDSNRWLPVVGDGSRAAYGVLERFVATVENPGLAARLRDAISGPKAFRRFQMELSRHDDEYTRWHRFRDDARVGHARAWLAERGYRTSR
jgi:Uncharacterised protein family (UPF0158)